MYTCSSCALHSCTEGNPEKVPKNCPMKHPQLLEEAFQEYEKPENREFYIKSTEIEQMGYCRWPRLKETLEFCKQMNYHKLGVAFCMGLSKEAKIIADIFRKHGFEVVSVICKTGGIPKERIGVPKEYKLKPDEFEPMCNPIAQAKLLNEQKTEFNILVGLCVGHDSMFYKYSQALVTTLIAKDRVLAHNPAGAVYCAEGYYETKLQPGAEF